MLGGRVAVLGSRLPSIEPGSWHTAGASSNDRGYNYAWRMARERFLKEHPLCVKCEAEEIIEPSTVVDHKIPHRGDQILFWDRNNWQALCTPHHSGEKQREENALGP